MSEAQHRSSWGTHGRGGSGPWAPPDLAPPAPPPPPPPTAYVYGVAQPPAGTIGWQSRPAPPSTLGTWLQVLMWGGAAVALIDAAVAFMARSRASAFFDDRSFVTATEWQDADDALGALYGVMILTIIASTIVTMVWGYRAHKVSQALHSGNRKWGQGWTVGGWFIPFANLGIPKAVLGEIEKIAAASTSGRADAMWRNRTPMAAGRVWWIAMIVGNFTVAVGSGMRDDIDLSQSGVESGYATQGVGHLIQVVALVCGAIYFRRFNQILQHAIGART